MAAKSLKQTAIDSSSSFLTAYLRLMFWTKVWTNQEITNEYYPEAEIMLWQNFIDKKTMTYMIHIYNSHVTLIQIFKLYSYTECLSVLA
jgi:hypothetical protein